MLGSLQDIRCAGACGGLQPLKRCSALLVPEPGCSRSLPPAATCAAYSSRSASLACLLLQPAARRGDCGTHRPGCPHGSRRRCLFPARRQGHRAAAGGAAAEPVSTVCKGRSTRIGPGSNDHLQGSESPMRTAPVAAAAKPPARRHCAACELHPPAKFSAAQILIFCLPECNVTELEIHEAGGRGAHKCRRAVREAPAKMGGGSGRSQAMCRRLVLTVSCFRAVLSHRLRALQRLLGGACTRPPSSMPPALSLALRRLNVSWEMRAVPAKGAALQRHWV